MRFDGSGNQTWVRQFGTAGMDEATSVAVRSSHGHGGAVVAAGSTDATAWTQASAGSFDALVTTMLS